MARQRIRVCAEPGCPELVTSVRCQRHRLESPTSLQRDWRERKRRERTVSQHVAERGWWCPGYADHPAHPSHDLTAAHIVAVANGGGDGPLTVLCRSENSRLRDRDMFE